MFRANSHLPYFIIREMKCPRPGQNQFVLRNFDTRERQLFKWEVTSSTHSIRGITSNFPRDSPHDTFPLPKNEQAGCFVLRHYMQCYGQRLTTILPLMSIDRKTSEDQKSYVFPNIWDRLSNLPPRNFRIVS